MRLLILIISTLIAVPSFAAEPPKHKAPILWGMEAQDCYTDHATGQMICPQNVSTQATYGMARPVAVLSPPAALPAAPVVTSVEYGEPVITSVTYGDPILMPTSTSVATTVCPKCGKQRTVSMALNQPLTPKQVAFQFDAMCAIQSAANIAECRANGGRWFRCIAQELPNYMACSNSSFMTATGQPKRWGLFPRWKARRTLRKASR